MFVVQTRSGEIVGPFKTHMEAMSFVEKIYPDRDATDLDWEPVLSVVRPDTLDNLDTQALAC